MLLGAYLFIYPASIILFLMSSIITRIIKEDFIEHVKDSFDSKPSFFCFLLHNCPEDEKRIIEKYINFDFNKDNKINLDILSYNNRLASSNRFYESLCQKKRNNPKIFLFLYFA